MTPILYSFRRCPYAMRARLALAVSGTTTELREIVLRDKAPAFLDASPSGTVPCMVTEGGVIDESLDIMLWALRRRDPEGWLNMSNAGHEWIARADGPCKHAPHRKKYATRYPDEEPSAHRDQAAPCPPELDAVIDQWIVDHPTLADFAILPFVRQFAFINKPWFDAQPWPNLQAWLERFLTSDRFAAIMDRYPKWAEGDAPTFFP